MQSQTDFAKVPFGKSEYYKSDALKRSELNKSQNWRNSEFLEFKRNINKLLMDEETVEKLEDGRESKFYFEKMRQLDLCRLTLLVQAQVVAILDYEIEFNNLNLDFANQFLYITLICSIFLIVMTYFTYEAKNQFIIATKQVGKNSTIFNTGDWKLMVGEMCIFLVFPQPWFQGIKVYFFVDYYQQNVYHYLNEVLLLVMMLRCFIMAKIILMNTQWYNERVSRICQLYATKMSPLFILKVYMKLSPMKVFWFCYCFCLLVSSYAIRICERPLVRDSDNIGTVANFNLYNTVIWVMMITIPTVGYGDTFPTTYHGRFIATMAAISGTFLFSIMCNSLIMILEFSYQEDKSNLILNKLDVLNEIQVTAAKMFSYAMKLSVLKKKNKFSHFVAKNLRKAASYFKSVSRQYKSLIDKSNLSEQIDKQFTYIQEEIGDLDDIMINFKKSQSVVISHIYQLQNFQDSMLHSHPYRQSFQHIHDSAKNESTTRVLRKKQDSSCQYYTEDMKDQGIYTNQYFYNYNMVSHINPNQFY